MSDALRIEVDSVEVRHLTAVGAPPGVVPLLAVARNGPGTGVLLCGEDTISWRAPGSETFGEEVDCSADGQYVVCDGEDADKWIRVGVYADYFVSGSQADVRLAEVYNNAVAGDDVDAAEAAVGNVATFSISLVNASAGEIAGLAAWVDSETDASIEISADGVNWLRPESEEAALALLPIPAEDSIEFHLRRTITAGAASSTRLPVRLHFTLMIFDT